jgi:hypothetical protein
MRTISKIAVAVALTGAMALAAATPSEARYGRNAAIIGGVAAGVLLGAAITNSNNGYYGDSAYYGERGYAYYGERGYAYSPDGYAYSPGPAYQQGRCWHATDSDRNFGYYTDCGPQPSNRQRSPTR